MSLGAKYHLHKKRKYADQRGSPELGHQRHPAGRRGARAPHHLHGGDAAPREGHHGPRPGRGRSQTFAARGPAGSARGHHRPDRADQAELGAPGRRRRTRPASPGRWRPRRTTRSWCSSFPTTRRPTRAWSRCWTGRAAAGAHILGVVTEPVAGRPPRGAPAPGAPALRSAPPPRPAPAAPCRARERLRRRCAALGRLAVGATRAQRPEVTRPAPGLPGPASRLFWARRRPVCVPGRPSRDGDGPGLALRAPPPALPLLSLPGSDGRREKAGPGALRRADGRGRGGGGGGGRHVGRPPVLQRRRTARGRGQGEQGPGHLGPEERRVRAPGEADHRQPGPGGHPQGGRGLRAAHRARGAGGWRGPRGARCWTAGSWAESSPSTVW